MNSPTCEDKINKIYDIVLRIEPMVLTHEKVLRGNGSPGLITQVTTIQTKQTECPARKAMSSGNRGNIIALGALVISLIVLVINLG